MEWLVKLVLFSDLHLDAAFAWLGAGDAARRRREALRTTLRAIIELAQREAAEALLCGGDLYEHARFSPDTGEFLRKEFASLRPMRVFVAPGNHDHYGPESLYRHVTWSDNVHIFTEAHLEPVALAPGMTLWGAAHLAPAGTANLLDGFRVDRSGVHLALFHGSESGGFQREGTEKQRHAPFEENDIALAGVHHALLGHYHTPRDADRLTYPGNPEPLSFGETGPRGAVVLTVRPDGSVERRRERVTQTQVHDLDCDVTGCSSRQDVRDRAADVLRERTGAARLTLRGELAPGVEIGPRDVDVRDLLERVPTLDAVVVHIGDLRAAYDFEAIGREPTVRGQFVRDVLADPELDEPQRRRVLVTGLRALDGRSDLEVP
jgi:DNA repair exonuclease SbcCD nuclease subunit